MIPASVLNSSGNSLKILIILFAIMQITQLPRRPRGNGNVPPARIRSAARVKPRALTVGLVFLTLAGCDREAPESTPVTPTQSTISTTTPTLVQPDSTAARYFFDVYGHTAEEITALLRRAQATHDELPEAEQDSITIALVLHGPDIKFFTADNYAQYRELVDLAASLDAQGYVDLKICSQSVSSRGLDAAQFPRFIEFVAYGPDEIDRLKSQGYVRF